MGNDMFNEEQLADAKVRADAAVLKESLTTDLGFDFVAYAREVMADKNHKDRDDLSCLATEIMGALVSSIDRLQGRLDSLHRSKVEYGVSERLKLIAAVKANAAEAEHLRLALAEATREAADATAAANIRAAEHRKERDLRAQAERERDEARAERDRAATIATQEAVGHSRALTALSRARETDGAGHPLDAEMALRRLLYRQRRGKPLDVEKYAHIALRHATPLRAVRLPQGAIDSARELDGVEIADRHGNCLHISITGNVCDVCGAVMPESFDDGYQVPPVNCGTFAAITPAVADAMNTHSFAEMKREDGAVREAALRDEIAWLQYTTDTSPLARLERVRVLYLALSSTPRPEPPTSDFHTSCDWCKRDIPNACYAVLCSDCDRRGNTALFAPPADAATEAVREAATRLRSKLGVPSGPILFRHKSGTLHRPDGKIPYGERRAELCDEDGITFAGSEVVEFALMVLDYFDAAKGGGR